MGIKMRKRIIALSLALMFVASQAFALPTEFSLVSEIAPGIPSEEYPKGDHGDVIVDDKKNGYIIYVTYIDESGDYPEERSLSSGSSGNTLIADIGGGTGVTDVVLNVYYSGNTASSGTSPALSFSSNGWIISGSTATSSIPITFEDMGYVPEEGFSYTRASGYVTVSYPLGLHKGLKICQIRAVWERNPSYPAGDYTAEIVVGVKES